MSNLFNYDSSHAKSIIENLSKRHMKGYYAETKEEALKLALSLINPNDVIGFGGSETLREIGLIPALEQVDGLTILDRSKVSPDKMDELHHKALNSDTYFMSTNAITLDGELINIDGNGNRVAALIYGPKQVIIIAGLNKIASNNADAMKRIKSVACIKNVIRLDRNTPCHKTGVCANCLADDCICMHTVITRNSRPSNRIKVILVGEELGY